jgi:hypothetical protein
MRDAGIGRVLVASLHQAISDELPTRLGFYESWLHAEGLRDGTIGLAPLYAVLSFLRQEGAAYDQVMVRAGEYAAEWSVAEVGAVERRAIESAPAWLRLRLIMRLARQLVRSSYQSSRMSARVRRGAAEINVRGSVFCSVREPVTQPLCRYYAAALGRMLGLFNVPGRVVVRTCRSTGDGGSHCILDMLPEPATSTGAAEVTAA